MSAEDLGVPSTASHLHGDSITALEDASVVKSFDKGLLVEDAFDSHTRSDTVQAVEEQRIVSHALGIFQQAAGGGPVPGSTLAPIVADTFAETEAVASAQSTESWVTVETASEVVSASMSTSVDANLDEFFGDSAPVETEENEDDLGGFQYEEDIEALDTGTATHGRVDTTVIVAGADGDLMDLTAATGSDAKDDDSGFSESKELSALGVWRLKRAEELSQRRDAETQAQLKAQENARKFVADARSKRKGRIEQAVADARRKESDIRKELSAVFEHGSIWEQVAKMVELRSTDTRTERMRNLIIALKAEAKRPQ